MTAAALAVSVVAVGISGGALFFSVSGKRRENAEHHRNEALKVLAKIEWRVVSYPPVDPPSLISLTVTNSGEREVRDISVGVFMRTTGKLVHEWQVEVIPAAHVLGASGGWSITYQPEADEWKVGGPAPLDRPLLVFARATFTDADGRLWRRDSTGVLERRD